MDRAGQHGPPGQQVSHFCGRLRELSDPLAPVRASGPTCTLRWSGTLLSEVSGQRSIDEPACKAARSGASRSLMSPSSAGISASHSRDRTSGLGPFARPVVRRADGLPSARRAGVPALGGESAQRSGESLFQQSEPQRPARDRPGRGREHPDRRVGLPAACHGSRRCWLSARRGERGGCELVDLHRRARPAAAPARPAAPTDDRRHRSGRHLRLCRHLRAARRPVRRAAPRYVGSSVSGGAAGNRRHGAARRWDQL